MRKTLSWLGARLGNLNDRFSKHDSRSEATLRWRVVDRSASWLHTRLP